MQYVIIGKQKIQAASSIPRSVIGIYIYYITNCSIEAAHPPAHSSQRTTRMVAGWQCPSKELEAFDIHLTGEFIHGAQRGGGKMDTILWVGVKKEKQVVVKTFAKTRAHEVLFRKEVDALQAVADKGVQNVVRMLDNFRCEAMMCIVLEKVEGEELFEIILKDQLNSTKIKSITRQLALILAEMHDAEISHGDIKPENIMVGLNGVVTLIDMGFSGSEYSETPCEFGTPWYMAPEQAKGAHDRAPVDMFAVGVTLYIMVFRKNAFEGRTRKGFELKAKDYHARFAIPCEWNKTSIEFRMILTSLMHESPCLRMTARELARCSWANSPTNVTRKNVGVQCDNGLSIEKKRLKETRIEKILTWIVGICNRLIKKK